MYKPPPLQPRYAWERAHKVINDYVDKLQLQPFYIAWMKAQLIIEAQFRFYSHVGNEHEDAISMAWEDFEMACRGRGEPGITGAIFHMLSRLPSKNDKEFKRVLESAFAEAHVATAPAALRYRDKDYKAKVHTLADGFDDPEAMPIRITTVEPAPKSPQGLKEQINRVTDFASPSLTVLEGSKDKPALREDDVF